MQEFLRGKYYIRNDQPATNMFALLHKEINAFFTSLTGYLVIIVFLTANSLIMWVFGGEFNVLDSGYANLDALFYWAPLVFLILVPAITMKLFPEEKRSGTMELLLTFPVSGSQIILAKYLASFLLILLSLLPTLVYYVSVHMLGSPPGNLDSGGIWGSYLGLLLLGAVYAAIGIFVSTLSDNQIISFIVTVLLCFLLSTGIDQLTRLDLFGGLNFAIMKLGIIGHYSSIRRGVVDTRDLVYFLSVIALFLMLSRFSLEGWGRGRLSRFGVSLVVIVVINFVSSSLFFRLDLTSEKRYTIAPVTRDVLRQLEEPAYIRVYLDGDLPSGFNRFKKAIRETLDEFRVYAGENLQYEFIDPAGDPDPANQRKVFNRLVEMGLQPTNAQVVQKDGSTMQKILFPGVIISYRGAEAPVNLLKNNQGITGEDNLQNSIQSLEYEFVIMLRNLSSDTIEKVAFLEGHGELDAYQVGDISKSLARFYQIDRGVISGRPGILDAYRAVIIAGPTEPFSEADKFVIDQYIMNGGRVLWLIDPVRVSMDSIIAGSTMAYYSPLNLEDQLFRYGVRINPNLVQDIQCHVIPVNKALPGGAPSLQISPWYYHPVVSPGNDHIITRALNMIWIRFASVIDTVGMDPDIKKTILLTTSPYTRVVAVPAEISLRETGIQPGESAYNKSHQALAVLLEGNFGSVFSNRPLPELPEGARVDFRERSDETRMILVSDADIIANEVIETARGPRPAPLGYDMYTKQTFGNSEFILNCINYLTRQTDLMSLRGKEFRIRLLDRRMILDHESRWKWINSLLPSLMVLLSGAGIWIIRNYRYKKPTA